MDEWLWAVASIESRAFGIQVRVQPSGLKLQMLCMRLPWFGLI